MQDISKDCIELSGGQYLWSIDKAYIITYVTLNEGLTSTAMGIKSMLYLLYVNHVKLSNKNPENGVFL